MFWALSQKQNHIAKHKPVILICDSSSVEQVEQNYMKELTDLHKYTKLRGSLTPPPPPN